MINIEANDVAVGVKIDDQAFDNLSRLRARCGGQLDVEAAVPLPVWLSGPGAMHAAGILARLREAALPAGAALPLPDPCYWDRKSAMQPAESAKADAACRPLRELLDIGSLKGSEGLWLF
jgi:hypothetical protein